MWRIVLGEVARPQQLKLNPSSINFHSGTSRARHTCNLHHHYRNTFVLLSYTPSASLLGPIDSPLHSSLSHPRFIPAFQSCLDPHSAPDSTSTTCLSRRLCYISRNWKCSTSGRCRSRSGLSSPILPCLPQTSKMRMTKKTTTATAILTQPAKHPHPPPPAPPQLPIMRHYCTSGQCTGQLSAPIRIGIPGPSQDTSDWRLGAR